MTPRSSGRRIPERLQFGHAVSEWPGSSRSRYAVGLSAALEEARMGPSPITRAIRSVLDELLKHLPEEKRRKYKRIMMVIGLTPIVLFLLWVGMQWIGPSAPVPAVDPIEILNQSEAGLKENAAGTYKAALEARTKPPAPDWIDYCFAGDKALDARWIGWVEENVQSVGLTRIASQMENCQFHYHRGRSGLIDRLPIRGLRDQARFISLRARVAAYQKNPDAFRDSLKILEGMAHHLAAFPGVLGDLLRLAIRGSCLEHSLRALQWLDSDIASQYAAELAAPWLKPLPDCIGRLDFERADACWVLSNARLGQGAWFFPGWRLAAEVDKGMAPYRRLVGQSVIAQMDPSNACWREIDQLRSWPQYRIQAWMNFPREIGTKYVNFFGYFGLRAMFGVHQQAARVILAIHSYADEHGHWPDLLDDLEGHLETLDPFTGKPLVYQRNGDGWMLYSLGVDRDDDGGVHNENALKGPGAKGVMAEREGDFVFWPPDDDDGI